MINSSSNLMPKDEIYKVIDFIQPTKQNTSPELKKELPPEPEPPKAPPKLSTEVQESSTADVPTNAQALNIEMPSVGNGMKLGGGNPKILAPIKMAKMDSVLTPMVQIKPLYPSKAKRMGTEGYVTVELDVDASGHVTAMKILKSVPEGVFNKSVKKALRKWKFRPKSIDGTPVAQKGVLTLKFNLGK